MTSLKVSFEAEQPITWSPCLPVARGMPRRLAVPDRQGIEANRVRNQQHSWMDWGELAGGAGANSHQMHYYPGSRTITGWREEERPRRLRMKAVRCRDPHVHPA